MRWPYPTISRSTNKVLRMTKKRRVLYPFLLGGVTVYIFLFIHHAGNNIKFYRKIANDLNPLNVAIDGAPLQYHEIATNLLEVEKATKEVKHFRDSNQALDSFSYGPFVLRNDGFRRVPEKSVGDHVHFEDERIDGKKIYDGVPMQIQYDGDQGIPPSLAKKESFPQANQFVGHQYSDSSSTTLTKESYPKPEVHKEVPKEVVYDKASDAVDHENKQADTKKAADGANHDKNESNLANKEMDAGFRKDSRNDKDVNFVKDSGTTPKGWEKTVSVLKMPVNNEHSKDAPKVEGGISSTISDDSKKVPEYVRVSAKESGNTSNVKIPNNPWRNDEFEKLNGLDLYVRNSFYDKRNDNGHKLIRTWALTPKTMPHDVYCHVIWVKKYGEVESQVILGYLRIQESSVWPFCKYFTGVIECPWNESYVPKYVTISPSKTSTPNHWHYIKHINLPEKPSRKIGICLKTLFDHSEENLGPLMEWFELNKLLGVDKVIMYSYDNVSSNVAKLIHHYKSMGFVSLKSWKLPLKTYTKNIYKIKFTDSAMRELVRKTTSNESDIPCVRYHAQHLTYMDCIYDNMHKYSYLIFIDVDEYIIPESNKTLKDLLWYLDSLDKYSRTASFVFEEACFSYQPSAVHKNNTRMTVLTQNYTRGPITSDHKAMKSVLRPRYVKNMHIHRVAGKHPSIWGYKGFDYIDRRMGKLHHYKNSGRCEPYNVTDKATSKFQYKLVESMTVLWNKLFGNG